MNDTQKHDVDYEHDGTPGVSRRSFLRLAFGSITVLPTVVGGFLLPDESPLGPTKAHADTNSTKIVVAQAYEAGLLVVDTKDGKHVPVPKAKVTVYSHFNKKTISGTTNDKGLWLADIRSIAEKTTKDGVEQWSCYVQIDVEAAGFRRFRVRRLKIEGAKGFQIPTCKLEGEKIYPMGVALDDWDVLYTKNEFCVTTANDAKHTFAVDFFGEGNATIQVSICEGDDRRVLASDNLTIKNKLGSKDLSDFFLLEKHKSALTVGKKYYLRYKADGKDYEVALQLTTVSAPTGASAPGSTNLTLDPFGADAMKPKIDIPSWVPIIGGGEMAVWTPDLPVQVAFDPFGYFKISYNSTDWGYKSKDGKPDPDAWKFHPRKSFEEQWSSVFKDAEDMTKKVGQARKKDGIFKNVEATKTLKFTTMFQAYVAGKWSLDTALWRGNAGLAGTIAFNFAYSQQFWAGPIPMIFEFSFLASLTVTVQVGMSTPEIKEPSKYALDYGSTGITFFVLIQPAISLGVGVKGLLSASVQGVLGFSINVHCGPLPSNSGNKNVSNPHTVLGIKVEINVVVQALIFTTKFNVLTRGEPKLYDNWNGGLKAQGEDLLFAKPDEWDTIIGGSADEPFELVPEESIAEVREFELGDWESFEEVSEDDQDTWIFWGEGTDEDTDEDNWYFFDADEEDDHYDGFIYDSEGFEESESVEVGGLSAQSESELEGQAKARKMMAALIEESLEGTTDDGVTYAMTKFSVELRPASVESQAEATSKGRLGEVQADTQANTQANAAAEQQPEPRAAEENTGTTMASQTPVDAAVAATATGPIETAGTSNVGVVAASFTEASAMSSAVGDAGGIRAASEGEALTDAAGTTELEGQASAAAAPKGRQAPAEQPMESVPTDTQTQPETTPTGQVSTESEQMAPQEEPLAPQGEQHETQAGQDAALTAQADTPKAQQGKRIKGVKQMNDAPTAGSVAKLAVGNGIKPSSDKVIAKDVFSDARGKIVRIDKRAYYFRIVSAQVTDGANKVSRTRVACSLFPLFKNPYVFDFDIKLSGDAKKNVPKRSDLYDYDFDVTYVKRKGKGNEVEIHLFIISGHRQKTISEAAADQVFTHASFVITPGSLKNIKYNYAYSNLANDSRYSATGKKDPYHTFSCPHIEYAEDAWPEKSGSTASGCIISFLDRSSSKAEDLLKKSDNVNVGLGLFLVGIDARGHHDFYAIDTSQFLDKDTVADKSIFEMRALPPKAPNLKAKGQSVHRQVIYLRGHGNTHYYVLRTSMADDIKTVKDKQGDYITFKPQLKSLKPLNVVDGKQVTSADNAPKRVVWWPGHDQLLASVNDKLMRATISDPDGDKPALSYEEAGPSSFGISGFVVDNSGTFAYWPTTQEGSPGYRYENADADSKELPKIMRYQVLSCKLRNGKFSDPFVYCEVEHDMDSLVLLSNGGSTMQIVSTQVTDAKNSKADMWCTLVMGVRCATVLGVECLSIVGYPERPATFYITIRNDGNTFLTGGKVTLSEKGAKAGSPTSSTQLTFSEKSIVESAFNPKGANGKLDGVEPDYALPPGKTAVYQVELTIPKGWSGEKQVSLALTDLKFSVVSNKAVKAQAEGDDDNDEVYEFDDSDAMEYVAGSHEDDYGEEGVPFDIIDVWYEDDLNDNTDGYDYELADAQITGDDEGGSSGGNSAGGSAGGSTGSSAGGSTSGTRQQLPRTADHSSGALPLGIAAAGAGLVAYSRRREALEHEDGKRG